MTTTIIANGSKWAGQNPDPIERFKERLRIHTLDPRFEEYGDFAMPSDGDAIPRGFLRFWGNFYDVSAVFEIQTDDPELIAELIALIKANKATTAYKDAKRERDEETKRRAARGRR